MTLNEQQLKAVVSDSPLIAVIAPAGSGKTKVLIERICDLAANKGVNEARILPISFTNKASAEMRERLSKQNITEVKAYTFHSLCFSLINGYATRLGYIFPVNAYDEPLATSILVDILISYKLPHKDPIKNEKLRTASVRVIRNALDKIYRERPDDWIRIDEEYNNRLKTSNAVDYSKMISETTRLLRENQDVRDEIHNAYTHVLIDEFQDTSPDQMELIDLIDPKNLFIIGDLDQAIYAWRGANPENVNKIIERKKKVECESCMGFKFWRGAGSQIKRKLTCPLCDDLGYTEIPCELINLNINYRSSISVIAKSNKVIALNENPFRVPAIPRDDAEEGVCSIYGGGGDVWWRAAKLAEQIVSRGTKPSDIAILCRDNGREHYPVGCYGVVENLKQMNVPYNRITRDQSFWDSPEVRNMIYTINLVLNHNDRASWSMAINFPFNRIGQRDRVTIRQDAVARRKTLMEVCLDHSNREVRRWAKKISNAMEDINSCDSATELFFKVVLDMNWEGYFIPLIGRKFNLICQKIKLQMKMLADAGCPTIQDFLEWWLSREDMYQSVKPNAVEVSTIHSYKGAEKKKVIIPGVCEDKFPKMSKKKLNLKEECNILYVAITRAEEECYILFEEKPSPFLVEAGFFKCEDEAPITEEEDVFL